MAVDPNDPRFWRAWGGQPALPGDAEWYDPGPQPPPYYPPGTRWNVPGHSSMDQNNYNGLANPTADDAGFWLNQSGPTVPMPTTTSPSYDWPANLPYIKANDAYSQPQPDTRMTMGEDEDENENAPYGDGYPQAYDAPFGFNPPLDPYPANPYEPINPWRNRRSTPPPGQGDVPPEPYLPWRR